MGKGKKVPVNKPHKLRSIPAKAAQEQEIPGLTGPFLPVIGMGASAGGLEAFQRFFANVPPQPGMAFVIVQDPGTAMSRRLTAERTNSRKKQEET